MTIDELLKMAGPYHRVVVDENAPLSEATKRFLGKTADIFQDKDPVGAKIARDLSNS